MIFISVCERVYALVVNKMIDCSILMSLWVTRVVYMIKSVYVGFLYMNVSMLYRFIMVKSRQLNLFSDF
jgi:hypothetical protein